MAEDTMSQAAIQPQRRAPPGPKGRFLVGNALDFSRSDCSKGGCYGSTELGIIAPRNS